MKLACLTVLNNSSNEIKGSLCKKGWGGEKDCDKDGINNGCGGVGVVVLVVEAGMMVVKEGIVMVKRKGDNDDGRGWRKYNTIQTRILL